MAASDAAISPAPTPLSHGLRSGAEYDGSNTTPASSVSPSEPIYDSNDVAVIGYACRVPGGNDSPSQLWDFLLKKGDASGDMPEMRWEPYNTRQPGNAEILSRTTSKGYFLDNLEDFDASFFGISPREAEQIDPQQRVALEVTWEALENSGIPPQSLSGSDTAVFMGVNSDDYSRLLLEDLPNVEAWMGVGTAFCGIPNRISYILDLMGPSSAIDAACASSLVAIHHGRQALLSRETSLVIAGGVNALAGPGLTRVLDKAGAISSDGRCRSFDDEAAGYGRGEGAGIVILKRLADAMEDEDQIMGVLKGSAVGADGRTNGIMAPNQLAQERVARQALKEAKVSPDTISYIEAHATSTPIGDPTECAAMANVYGSGARAPGSKPCYVGSIKSNIGHLEAGAGVMGFIKAVMVLKNGLIPPQANLNVPNRRIDWETSLLKTTTEPVSFPPSGYPRKAAIASYGYGGTVSHAIIEAAPPVYIPSIRRFISRSNSGSDPTVLLVSAPQASRLKTVAARIASWLEDPNRRISEREIHSLAYTLAVKRGHHKFRTASVVANKKEAIDVLKDMAEGQQNSQTFAGRALSSSENAGAVWVFSGHGAQWKEMGQQLIEEEPAFIDVVELLEPIIQQELKFSAINALRSGNFDTAGTTQVLTYVMQVGLAAVLEAKGAKPQAVIGHSLGEIAAAVVAAALTLREGALICCARAHLFDSVARPGAMVLVSLPFSQAVREVGSRDDLCVAIDSSPTTCVVSGSIEAVQAVSAKWKQRGLQVRTVKSDIAFHSPLLLPLAECLRARLVNVLAPTKPKLTLYSTTSSNHREVRIRNANYWVDNMVQPVLLTSAVQAASEDGYKVFLEVSSHPIVSHSISETLQEAGAADDTVIPTLLRNKNARRSILLAIGKLHCLGGSIEFKNSLAGNWLPDVPGTTWDHQPYWRKVSVPTAERRLIHKVDAHNLLGGRTQISGTGNVLWQTHLDPKVKPFSGDHLLHGAEIVPAAVLMNTFLAAAPGYSLSNISLRVPVIVGAPREVQVLRENKQIQIWSRLAAQDPEDGDNHSWLLNTTTQFFTLHTLQTSERLDIESIKKQLSIRLSDSFSVDYLANVGVSGMGFPWKVIEHLEREDEMLAKVHADPESKPSRHWAGTSWASILDAATSISSTLFHREPLLRMPTAIGRITVSHETPTPKISYISVKKAVGPYAADILISDEEGNVVVDIQNLRFAGIEGSPLSKRLDVGLTHRIAWPPAKLAETPVRFQDVTFIASESPLLQSYRSYLSSIGIETSTVRDPEGITGNEKNTIFVMIADSIAEAGSVYVTSAKNCEVLLNAVKKISQFSSPSKIFCITKGVSDGTEATSLSQASLFGLARIVQSEEPEIFGGLIDVEDDSFPMQAIKYVQGVDVIRMDDFVARNARLRPFVQTQTKKEVSSVPFGLSPHGAYLITGGLGALGLEVASWLVEKGAKRLILVSRRKLPSRLLWGSLKDNLELQHILSLEGMGVSVHAVPVDMSAPDAASRLKSALDGLSLPPICGVIHAAGTLANQHVSETTTEAFNSVISPKIVGAMALHELFPPKTLDFMVFFSSCGQLLGFPGQASYASGNSFLDTLATYRRKLGDNTTSMLWTSWRGLGMAASTKYIDAELHARGITDVTKEEAFYAWEQVMKHNTDHGVVLRTLPLEEVGDSPHSILEEILPRPTFTKALDALTNPDENASQQHDEPTSGPELEKLLTKKVTQCVASTLALPLESVDPHVALSELGMDSVMTVGLRAQLQKAMGVRVGPTLVWNCPTVRHLVRHFVGEKEKEKGGGQ